MLRHGVSWAAMVGGVLGLVACGEPFVTEDGSGGSKSSTSDNVANSSSGVGHGGTGGGSASVTNGSGGTGGLGTSSGVSASSGSAGGSCIVGNLSTCGVGQYCSKTEGTCTACALTKLDDLDFAPAKQLIVDAVVGGTSTYSFPRQGKLGALVFQSAETTPLTSSYLETAAAKKPGDRSELGGFDTPSVLDVSSPAGPNNAQAPLRMSGVSWLMTSPAVNGTDEYDFFDDVPPAPGANPTRSIFARPVTGGGGIIQVTLPPMGNTSYARIAIAPNKKRVWWQARAVMGSTTLGDPTAYTQYVPQDQTGTALTLEIGTCPLHPDSLWVTPDGGYLLFDAPDVDEAPGMACAAKLTKSSFIINLKGDGTANGAAHRLLPGTATITPSFTNDECALLFTAQSTTNMLSYAVRQ